MWRTPGFHVFESPPPPFDHLVASQPEPTHLALQKLDLEQQDHWHPTGCPGFYVGLGFSTRNHERNAKKHKLPRALPTSMQHPRFPTPSFDHPAASQPEPTHLALQKLELEQQDHWHPTGCLGFYVGLGFSTRNHERNAKDINHPGLYPLLCNTLGFPLLRLIILRLHIQIRRCRGLNLNSRIIGILQGVPGSMLAWAFPLETMKGTQKT